MPVQHRQRVQRPRSWSDRQGVSNGSLDLGHGRMKPDFVGTAEREDMQPRAKLLQAENLV